MRRRPNERIERLVEAALGERPEADLGQLSLAETHRLAQLRTIAGALRTQHFQAPESLVRSAKTISKDTRPVTMHLVTSSLQLAGARAAAEVVHAAYEYEAQQVRLMYVREPDGWRVMGHAPEGGWTIVTEDELTESDVTGRFEVTTTDATPPTLLLVRDRARLLIVPPSELQ
jgi:hypothetical protein